MRNLKLFTFLLFLYSTTLNAQDTSRFRFYIGTNYNYNYYDYGFLKAIDFDLKITIEDITYPRLIGSCIFKNKIIVKTGFCLKKEFYEFDASGFLYSYADTIKTYKKIYKDNKYICMPLIVGAEIFKYKKNSIYIELEFNANLLKKGVEQSSSFDGINSTSNVNNISSWKFKPQILKESILQIEYHRSIKRFYASFITALSLDDFYHPNQFDIGVGI